MRAVLLFAAAVTWSAGAAAGGEIVRVKVVEGAGAARESEPITCGVPFPEGAVKDAAQLQLLDAAGKPVPGSFTAVNHWPDDKSVRWAHLDAQVSVPADGTAEFVVAEGKPAAPAAPLVVKDEAEAVTVSTGAVEFSARKKGFRLFESVSTGGRKVLESGPEGLAMTVAGKRYTTAADAESKVTVEEQTPMRVTILATGRLAGPGKDRYDYEVRVHAYAGSRRVKIAATVTKKYGHPRDMKHFIEDLSLGLKLAGGGDLAFAVGGDGPPAAGKLAAGKKAGVLVSKSTEWKFSGQASGGGDPRAKKPLTLGWARLGAVSVGVHRFWQVFPKAIELSGDGSIAIGLYPKAVGSKRQFFTGMARTHEVLLHFGDGKESTEDVQKMFVGFQKPLFAACPPEWYCGKTGVFGTLAAAGKPMAPGAGDAFKTFDANMSKWFDDLAGPRRDRWRKRGVTMDAYGWLAFGDTLHWVWNNGKSKGTPWDIAWDSNYYDLAHIAAMNYARTGDAKFLEWFRDQTWHFMDVDVCHWNPGYKQGGASRRCPATNHVGYDAPDHMSPIINVAFDHHKSESLYERFYLLGDRRALKVGLELSGHARRHRDGDYKGTRKPGHQIISLMAGYRHTGDKGFLERARKVIDTGIKRLADNGGTFNTGKRAINFTDGIAIESFGKYYLVTGEKDVLDAIRKYCDYLIANGKLNYSNAAFGCALLYRETGEEKYLNAALKLLNRGKPGHLSKDTGHMYRSTANASGMLLPRK
ncbi:MAG: exo-rhamnogalacturonan lyase family protein [Planctomycetota bacterium]|jgi:hypothetical protein